MRRVSIVLGFFLLFSAPAWALPTTYLDCAPHNMSNNTTPSPYVASASLEYIGVYVAAKAFGGVNTFADAWIANTTGSVWIQIDLGTACQVYQYRLAPHEAARMPKTWILEGSNSGTVGTWTTLDTQTNFTSWVDNEAQDFLINAGTAYRYYRWTSSANNGDSTYTSIGEISLFRANAQAWPLKVTTSAYYNNTYPGWLAFDGLSGSGFTNDVWIVQTTGSCWIQADMGSAVTFNTYEFLPHEASRAPKTWILEGSNSGTVGTWTTLDTRTNVTSWVTDTSQIFVMSSPGSYRYYRLTSSANNGDASFTGIAEMFFYNTSTGAVRHKSQVF